MRFFSTEGPVRPDGHYGISPLETPGVFDESAVPGTAPSDLHYSLTRRFLQGDVAAEPSTAPPEDSPEASEDTLRKLRIVTDDADGRARLTLTGVLLCTPEPQRWLPHAYIQAVSYAGERSDTDYQTDARDIGGPLDRQVADALHFVSLLARCVAPSGVGRTRLMDRRGDGVPIIRRECRGLSGRLPEYSLIDESELRLVIRAAG